MIARRLTGILLSLLTLNVTVLGADSSCAKHATTGEHANNVQASASSNVAVKDLAISNMASSTATGAMAVEMTDKGAHHAPCEIPSKSNCCGAFVSCSVVFQTNEVLVSSNPVQMRETIANGFSTPPLSEIVTPDPPPPKA